MLHKAVIGQAGVGEECGACCKVSLKSEISPVAAAWFAVCEGKCNCHPSTLKLTPGSYSPSPHLGVQSVTTWPTLFVFRVSVLLVLQDNDEGTRL